MKASYTATTVVAACSCERLCDGGRVFFSFADLRLLDDQGGPRPRALFFVRLQLNAPPAAVNNG